MIWLSHLMVFSDYCNLVVFLGPHFFQMLKFPPGNFHQAVHRLVVAAPVVLLALLPFLACQPVYFHCLF